MVWFRIPIAVVLNQQPNEPPRRQFDFSPLYDALAFLHPSAIMRIINFPLVKMVVVALNDLAAPHTGVLLCLADA